MGEHSWPSKKELERVRKHVAGIAGRSDFGNVRVVVSPYRICPLGAHIDHQGGAVSAMTINKGILLGFIPSGDSKVLIQSGQFQGEVRFRIDEIQHPRSTGRTHNTIHAYDSSGAYEECEWGNYARGAVYALQIGGKQLSQGIIGFICGSEGLDSSGLSSSAAVGIAYLLAFQSANSLTMTPAENIEFDRIIENAYLGLRNGILDQSAILLSSYGCLTYMDCKTKNYRLIYPPKSNGNPKYTGGEPYKILLAFSGLKHSLANNPGYNCRVSECQEAAKILLSASGNEKLEPLLCNVEPGTFEAHKGKLSPNLRSRAEHYFSENRRVMEGLKAWASGNLEEFGKLISASGLSSIHNYDCDSSIVVHHCCRDLQAKPGRSYVQRLSFAASVKVKALENRRSVPSSTNHKSEKTCRGVSSPFWILAANKDKAPSANKEKSMQSDTDINPVRISFTYYQHLPLLCQSCRWS